MNRVPHKKRARAHSWIPGDLALPVFINDWSKHPGGPPWIILHVRYKGKPNEQITALGKGGITRSLKWWNICKPEDYPTQARPLGFSDDIDD